MLRDVRCVADGAEQRDVAEQSSWTLQSKAGAEQRTPCSGACREASDGAKRRMERSDRWGESADGSTTRRLNNGDDYRQGRRGYCVKVGGGGTQGMTTVASDGGGGDDGDDGDNEKSLWL